MDKVDIRFSRISEKWIEAHNAFQEVYEKIQDGYRYLSGDQYDELQRSWYERIRRPSRSFNNIFPMVNFLMGDFIQNDQKIKVYPRPGADPKIADILAKIVEHEDFHNSAKSFLTTWALAGIIRIGYACPKFTNKRDPNGCIEYENVDEFQVCFDPASRHPLLDDARFVSRSQFFEKEDILEFADRKDRNELKQLLVDRLDQSWEPTLDIGNQGLIANELFLDEPAGLYRVIEWHEMVWEDVESVYDPETGYETMWTLEGKKADLFFKIHPQYKIRRSRRKRKKIITYIPSINYLLYERDSDIQDGTYDIVPFSAYPYGPKTVYNFGLIENARDIQDDLNSWANMANTTIAKVLDPGHKYLEGAVVNEEVIESFGSMPGVNFIIKNSFDVNSAIRQNEIPKVPFAPNEMTRERSEMLMKVLGFTPNLLGEQESAHENASLFAHRVKQAKTSLAIIYSNFSRSKVRFYEKVIRMIQENYVGERVFPVVSAKNDAPQEIIVNKVFLDKILNDITIGEFYIQADDMERNPSARNLRLLQKTEIIQSLMGLFGQSFPLTGEMIVALMDWWLKESDLGDTDKLIQIFAGAVQQTQQAQAQQAGEQMAYQKAESLMNMAKIQNEMTELPPEKAEPQSAKKAEKPKSKAQNKK